MGTPAIQVENLTKNYGPVLALDRVSFSVQAGELVGFLGPNGAGKSTCMRILTTWLPASSGYARLAGFDVMYQSMEVRRRIGYLPESIPLYPEMRVREYLQYRARIKGVERSQRGVRVDYCMERCHIREVRNRLLGTLSKGYRQRVGLADALLADPPILILDEPTSGLDPVQIGETLQTIRELGGRHTVLLSTHILSEVEKVCERVIIIDKGQIKLDESLQRIAQRKPTYVLEIRGPRAEVGQWLRQQPEVAVIAERALEPEFTAYEIHSQDGKDPREELAHRLISQNITTGKNWGLRRLDVQRINLEALFADVVLRRSREVTESAPDTTHAEGSPQTLSRGVEATISH
jgi:ABC-2 type transport system ATP-binding protein